MSTSSPDERLLARTPSSQGSVASVVSPNTGGLQSNHFAFADGLRALAILLVVLNHFALFGHLTLLGHKNDLAFLGRWGVNCFFLLSGFLLSRSFLKSILDRAGKFPSVPSYLLRRFYRIYPLYALAVILSALVGTYVTGKPALAFVLTHLTFTHGFFVDQINSDLNAPLWTMIIDVQFYLALPVVAFVAQKALAGRSRSQKRSALFSLLAVLSILSLAYRYAAFKYAPLAQNDFEVALVYVRNFAGMLPAFALGAALSIAQLEFDVSARRGVALLAFAFGIAIFMFLGLLKSGGSSLTVKVIADLFAAISATAIFYGLWTVDVRGLTRLVGSSFVTEAAALAYGIYLIHWPILGVFAKLLHADRAAPTPWHIALLCALSICVILPCAYLMHRFVENPFLSANERLRRTAT